MASETAGTRREFIMGAARVITADLTAVSDADTWTPGLSTVVYAGFTNRTATPTATQVNLTWASAGTVATITFDNENATDAQTGTMLVIGY